MATDKMYNGHVGKMVVRGSFTVTTGGAVLAVLPAAGRVFTVVKEAATGTYTVTFFQDKFAEISFAGAQYNPTAAADGATEAFVSARTGGSQPAQASITILTVAAAALINKTSGSIDFEVEVAYFSGNA